MANVQQLLPLLTVWVASHESTKSALDELQSSVDQTDSFNAETRQHILQFSCVLEEIERKSVKAEDLEKAVSDLQKSTENLDESTLKNVEALFNSMSTSVGKAIMLILEHVAWIKQSQEAMHTAIDHLQVGVTASSEAAAGTSENGRECDSNALIYYHAF